jgi:glycerol-3-phosphate O-acyltransferase/dihydroxyacetone phosphate acyltransferase
MIHRFLRFSLKLVFWIYYRKVDVTGVENIPASGPVILACNHPNSFLDALLVGVYTKRRIYFLARSDVFNTPFKRWLLEQASVLPVYRLQEGMENLDKNKETFSKCFEILDQNALILIFSEGLCIQELRLRQLKKGTARIALEYVKEGKHVYITPVGLNYLYPCTAREEVIINIGKPFDAAGFSDSYAANAGKAINEFNKELESKLRQSVIDIKDKSNEAALTQVLKVARNEGKDLVDLVKTAAEFELLRTTDPRSYASLVESARVYSAGIRKANIDDRTMKDQRSASILLQTLEPLYWLGRLLNGLPFVTAKWLAKTKVRKVEFYDSVFLGAFMFVNQFHNLFVFLILLFIHPFLAVVVPGVLLLTGGITTALHDRLTDNILRKRKANLPIQELETLDNLRRDIIRQIPG